MTRLTSKEAWAGWRGRGGGIEGVDGDDAPCGGHHLTVSETVLLCFDGEWSG